MSEENVELVSRAYEGINAHLRSAPELFGPADEVDATEVAPDVGVVQGYEASNEAFLPYWNTFDAFHIEIDEVIHADEGRVVTAIRDGGRIKGSDAEVWNRFFHVWTFGDGKIVRLSIHTDRGRALEAAGLRE